MRVTVIVALGIVHKGLERRLEVLEIRGRIETIQTTALLRSARILRKVLKTLGGLLSCKTTINAGVKNSQGVKQQQLQQQQQQLW